MLIRDYNSSLRDRQFEGESVWETGHSADEGRPPGCEPSSLGTNEKVATARQPSRAVTTQNRAGRMAVAPSPTLDVPFLRENRRAIDRLHQSVKAVSEFVFTHTSNPPRQQGRVERKDVTS